MNDTVNILLVDDEARNLEVLECILQSPEYRLVRAQKAEDALLTLLETDFAAIVLDIQMPGMSGIELANLVKERKRTAHIPIIFLTAYFHEDKDILQGYEVGAVDYLTKPINSQILKSKIAVFVELFRKTRALAASNAALELEVAQRQQAEEALRQANSELEARVRERTTDLSRANRELRISEERYRLILENALEYAIFTMDKGGRVTTWNAGAQRILGFEEQEIVGQRLDVILTAEDREKGQLDLEMGRALANGRAQDERWHLRKGGNPFWASGLMMPLKDEDGLHLGFLKILRDGTARKQAEDALRESEARLSAASRAKDEFLATLSHELRTPLNPVLLLASEGAENAELPAAVQADFATIRKNVELEARLIDDLLDLTRIARGKFALEIRPCDVHVILHDAIKNVRVELDQKRLHLILRLAAEPCVVWGDDVRLQQAFGNVLANAVKFTPERGTITIETSVSAENDKLAVKVTDTGIGLTLEEMKRVFEAFSQGDHAGPNNSHRFGGLGLGLAISRKLVELQKGAIRAFSAGRDRGSTFLIELPLASAGERAGNAAPAAEPGSSLPLARQAPARALRRILLVEDHGPTRDTLVHLLGRRKFEVFAVGSIAEARARAEQEDFDLLISDIGLPDGNGYDLMAFLREQRGLKGIALTGYGMEQDVARSQASGFIAHLTKPVSVQALESALAAANNTTPDL